MKSVWEKSRLFGQAVPCLAIQAGQALQRAPVQLPTTPLTELNYSSRYLRPISRSFNFEFACNKPLALEKCTYFPQGLLSIALFSYVSRQSLAAEPRYRLSASGACSSLYPNTKVSYYIFRMRIPV